MTRFLRWPRSGRPSLGRAWFVFVMLAGGLLFLTIHFGESARKRAADALRGEPSTAAKHFSQPEKTSESDSE